MDFTFTSGCGKVWQIQALFFFFLISLVYRGKQINLIDSKNEIQCWNVLNEGHCLHWANFCLLLWRTQQSSLNTWCQVSSQEAIFNWNSERGKKQSGWCRRRAAVLISGSCICGIRGQSIRCATGRARWEGEEEQPGSTAGLAGRPNLDKAVKGSGRKKKKK